MLNLVLTAIVVGMLVGLISSVFGLGGGIILVPALNIVFHFSQNEAIATSLATIALTTLLNTIRFAQKKEIDWSVVFNILIFSAVSASLGGYLVSVLSEKILLTVFILFLFYVLLQMFWSHQFKASRGRKKSRWFWATSIGFSSGLISGTTGVGGGIIITPLLFKSGIVETKKAVPITNVVMFFNAFFSLIPMAFSDPAAHSIWGMGLIHFDQALLLFLGAIPASLIGTKYQAKISVGIKKKIIALILFIILSKMLSRLL